MAAFDVTLVSSDHAIWGVAPVVSQQLESLVDDNQQLYNENEEESAKDEDEEVPSEDDDNMTTMKASSTMKSLRMGTVRKKNCMSKTRTSQQAAQAMALTSRSLQPTTAPLQPTTIMRHFLKTTTLAQTYQRTTGAFYATTTLPHNSMQTTVWFSIAMLQEVNHSA
jgi:hypothetical protein